MKLLFRRSVEEATPQQLFQAVSYDNPQILCMGDTCRLAKQSGKSYFVPSYRCSVEECAGKTEALLEKARQVCDNVKGKTDYEKELFFHDYLIEHCAYHEDTGNWQAYTAAGALLNGKAVCEGYSRAFQLLLNQEGFDNYLNELKVKKIEALGHHPNHEELEKILSWRIRSEKVAIKDIKLRTFIAEGNSRNDLAAHVYDITYGSLVPHVDNLVIIDDSIVRGTTLRQSIIGILDRLHPKKIVIVSSSPQVRYPDYYGIDMASMDQFIAFKAAIDLLKERDMKDVIARAYNKSKDQVGLPKEQMVNYVKEIYAPFTNEEIAAKMVELLTPKGTQAKVEIVYQTLEGLHEACPNHTGDWYFSGDYPTPGGVKLVNQAFIDYIEKVYQF